jgi:transposase
VIADLEDSIKSPLNIGGVTNKDSITDFERFKMLKPNVTANANPVAKFPRCGPPDRPAHQNIKVAVRVRKPTVLFYEGRRRVCCRKVR